MGAINNLYGNPEFAWERVEGHSEVKLALITKAGKAIKAEEGTIYVCSRTSQIIAKFPKAHYAEGRVLKLISNIEGVSPGEYKIVEKEGQNYAYGDTLRLKRHIPVLDTARKANNWAEKQMRYEEAMEGFDLLDITRKMLKV